MFQLLLLALLSLSVSSFAAPMARLAPDEVHEGKVVAVAEGTVSVLDDQDQDVDKFVVNASTTITRNGKPAKLADVRPGDKAKVTASQVEGKLIAKSVAAIAPE